MDKIKKQAIELGLCQEWQDNWDESGLVEKYINGITWCMKKEFPSFRMMKPHDKALLRNGVYNNKTATIKCDRDFYVFNASNINIEIGNFDVCRIYAGRGGNINITAKDNAIVIIDNYGSNINIVKTDNARCVTWELSPF